VSALDAHRDGVPVAPALEREIQLPAVAIGIGHQRSSLADPLAAREREQLHRVVEPARGAARALAIAGVALPLRDWDFATLALEAAPSAEPSPLQADGVDCDSGCDDEAGRARPRVLH
jgi:hypothetical protein